MNTAHNPTPRRSAVWATAQPASQQMKGLICHTTRDMGTRRVTQPQKGNQMKTILTIAALLAAPAYAGDYVDANGCTHIDKGGYFNLGLEPGCGRVNKEGGALAEIARAEEEEEDK